MSAPDDAFADTLLAEIARHGVARSADLQRALGRSQPTLSRALRSLAGQVVVLGAQRSARYAIAQPLRGLPGQQPLDWTDTQGRRTPWGTLTHLGNGRLHVQAPDIDVVATGGLPWFLAPLKLQGFLGRLWARSPAAAGLDANPERWRADELLAVLLQGVHDLPGAIGLGESREPPTTPLPAEPAARLAHLDALAADVARTLPAGSSAGGEQAKFLVANAEAWDAGRRRFDATIEGTRYRRLPTSRYRVWCLEQLQHHWERLAEPPRAAARALLERHGCWAPLWRAELVRPSGHDPEHLAPFGRGLRVF